MDSTTQTVSVNPSSVPDKETEGSSLQAPLPHHEVSCTIGLSVINWQTRGSRLFNLVPASSSKSNKNCLKRSEVDNSYSVHVYKALQLLTSPEIHYLSWMRELVQRLAQVPINIQGWGEVTPALVPSSFQTLSCSLELWEPCECSQLPCALGDSKDQFRSHIDWQRKPFFHRVNWCFRKGVPSTVVTKERNTSNVSVKPTVSSSLVLRKTSCRDRGRPLSMGRLQSGKNCPQEPAFFLVGESSFWGLLAWSHSVPRWKAVNSLIAQTCDTRLWI